MQVHGAGNWKMRESGTQTLWEVFYASVWYSTLPPVLGKQFKKRTLAFPPVLSCDSLCTEVYARATTVAPNAGGIADCCATVFPVVDGYTPGAISLQMNPLGCILPLRHPHPLASISTISDAAVVALSPLSTGTASGTCRCRVTVVPSVVLRSVCLCFLRCFFRK